MKPITAIRDLIARDGKPGKFGWPYGEQQTHRMIKAKKLGPIFRLEGSRLDLIFDEDLARCLDNASKAFPRNKAA